MCMRLSCAEGRMDLDAQDEDARQAIARHEAANVRRKVFQGLQLTYYRVGQVATNSSSLHAISTSLVPTSCLFWCLAVS